MAGRGLSLSLLALALGAPAMAAPVVEAPSRMGVAMSGDLAARKASLATRARQLELRERLLEASEKRVDAKIAALQRLQSEAPAVDRRTASLAKLYQAMRPREAARIVERLDLGVQVAVAGAMRERAMAAIMAQMHPDAARTLSMALAGRPASDAR